LAAKKRKKAELLKNKDFMSLSKPERKDILDRLDERLDAGDISARAEMRGRKGKE
jgi:hypothetical protein